MGTADPAEARKRRKAIISSQRHDAPEGSEENVSTDAQDTLVEDEKLEVSEESNAVTKAKKRKTEVKSSDAKPSSKKRAQMQYNPPPDVTMDKNQLAAWRREQRRVRNRESAAASRQRIRSRITELEEEVSGWRTKYENASARLQELEQIVASASNEMSDPQK